MVTVLLAGVPSTALLGVLSVNVNVSFGSSIVSLMIATLTVLLVSPGAKVSVLLVGV
jgi:hypothetical protein